MADLRLTNGGTGKTGGSGGPRGRNLARAGRGLAVAGASAGGDAAAPILLEFESPTAALLARPVPMRSRYVTWLIFSMVAIAVFVSATLPIDRQVTTTGKVVSTANNLVVQPLDVSIVRSIDVKEGELVHKGDLLARLDPTFATADAGSLETQVSSLQSEVNRLVAEGENKPYVSDGTPPSQLQAVIYAQRHAEQSYKLENYAQKIDALKVKASSALADVKSYTERLGGAVAVEGMRRQLELQGVGSKLNSLAATDSRVELSRNRDTALATVNTAQGELDAMIAERDGYAQQVRGESSQQLTEQGRKLAEARESLNKARLRRNLVELRAARDSIVLTIAPVSVGSVMQSGDQFITMVPVDTPLDIETVVDGRDAGFVQVGDPVTIKFETFPYFVYGTAQGTVRQLSADSFHRPLDERDKVGRPRTEEASGSMFFRAKISMDEMRLRNLPSGFRITPGMPVTADVKVGERTVIQYMMSRVIPVATGGMHEP